VNANRDGQVRYIVRFVEGGSAMRWYDQPLEQHGRVVEDGAEYLIVRVEQPSIPNGLGHAWAELAEPPVADA